MPSGRLSELINIPKWILCDKRISMSFACYAGDLNWVISKNQFCLSSSTCLLFSPNSQSFKFIWWYTYQRKGNYMCNHFFFFFFKNTDFQNWMIIRESLRVWITFWTRSSLYILSLTHKVSVKYLEMVIY